MKKQIKTKPNPKLSGTISGVGHISSTNDLHKVRQSVNQKVERSEEDVKERFNQVVTPLAFLIIIDILLSFVNLIR